MNTTALLGILAPHAEALKAIGCEVIECRDHPWMLVNGSQVHHDADGNPTLAATKAAQADTIASP